MNYCERAIKAAFPVFLLTVFVFAGANANAESKAKFNVDVEPAITITIPTEPTELNILPTESGAFGETTLTVYTTTNNPSGYNLSITPKNNQVNLVSDKVDSATGNPYIIPAVTSISCIPYEDFKTTNNLDYKNHFAVKNNEYNVFCNFTSYGEYDSYESEAVNRPTNLDFGVNVDLSIPSGSYTLELVAQATTRPNYYTLEESYMMHGMPKVSVGGNEYYRMQDMSKEICDFATNVSSMQAVDIRDNKIYWIAKTRDSRCWMTQNLDLDLDNNRTYTSADTNVLEDFKPAYSTAVANINSEGYITNVQNSQTVPYSYDLGDWYWTDSWYSGECKTTALDCSFINPNAVTEKFSATPYQGNGTHGHIGNYYNFPAALAVNDASIYGADYGPNGNGSTLSDSSYNPTNSICPAGWRLPKTETDTSKSEISKMISSAGSSATDQNITKSPLYLVRGGHIFWESGGFTLMYAGIYGYYWTSTIHDQYNGSSLFFTDNGTHHINGYARDSLRSIRCINQD